MTTFEIPLEHPSTPELFGADDGHEALRRLAPELAALHPDDIVRVNVDVPKACAMITGALSAIRSLRPAMLEQLPKLPIEIVDQLEDRTLALYYGHLMSKPRRDSSERLAAVYDEARALRAEMIEQAEALARRGLLDRDKVAEIRAGSGYVDMASDVVALSLLFRQSWEIVRNKTVIEQADCERADRVGRELLSLVGSRSSPSPDGLTKDQALERRDRCFTLFIRSYWYARQAADHLRWWEGDANDFVPSIFTKPRGRAAADAAAMEPAAGG